MRARRPAWLALRAGGMEILQVAALSEIPWVVHGFSTRAGGTSVLAGERVLNLGGTEWDTRARVEANRKKFLAALGADRIELVLPRQIHSDAVHVMRRAPRSRPSGDALLTAESGMLLGVKTADCVPILLVDVRHRVVGVVHAGWRGTLKRVAAKALGRMRMEFATRPADVRAAIGPGIGRCCYEVGPEVTQAFAGQFSNARDWFDGPFDRLASGEEPNPLKWLSMTPPGHDAPAPRVRLDLAGANRSQLVAAGVPGRNIVTSELCTACRTDLFFSHRRERGRTGRLLAVAGILPDKR